MRKREARPLWVPKPGSGAHALEAADLTLSATSGSYDEKWLQQLLHDNPEVLPLDQIETDFGEAISVCKELPLDLGAGRSGFLDNLLVTQSGRLVLIETKLWRNPESRRKVIAQALEYASAVFKMSYEELDAAVRRASHSATGAGLAQIVGKHVESFDEPTFIDAVSRNLRLGRAIIAVVGDGIREDLASLAQLLQSHAGHRFTFALVELAVFQSPDGTAHVVVPSVLAQTAMIERGVVQIEDGKIVVSLPQAASASAGKGPSFGITTDEYFDELGKRIPSAPTLLKDFIAAAVPIGIKPEVKKAMSLKHSSEDTGEVNLAAIDRYGLVDTGTAAWSKHFRLARLYNQMLANRIGGMVRDFEDGSSALRTAAGKMPRVTDLLPQAHEVWLEAIAKYLQGIRDEDKASNAN